MRIFLVRHGQTRWNAEQRAQGHTDTPLDERGSEQADLLARAFQSEPLGRVVASDLERAWRTAKGVADAQGLQVEHLAALRERAFGDWEGMAFEQIGAAFLEQEQATGTPREEIRPPAGESQLDVWRRLETVAEDLLKSEAPVMVVSHGGTCSLLLAKLLRGTLYTARSFRFDNTGVTTLVRRPDGGLQLLRYNDTSHLLQPALSGSVDGTIR